MTIATRIARLERQQKDHRDCSLPEMSDDELLAIAADGDAELLTTLKDETSGALETLVSAHRSDCAVNALPAFEAGDCDCGGLDLAVDNVHRLVPTLIPSTGRFGFFIGEMGRERFIEPHELPPLALAAIAASANLPDAHNAVAVLRGSNGMDLHDARETVIAKLKAHTATQRVTRG